MSNKEEPTKPETPEQQPKTQGGELDEKQLDQVTGAGVGGGGAPKGPAGPGG
jgi:hypothetical protein